MKVAFAPEAQADLEDAIDFYLASAGVGVATAFELEVMRIAALVADFPLIGHSVTVRTRAFGLRGFPYDVVYRPTNAAVVVVALAHHRRDPAFRQSR